MKKLLITLGSLIVILVALDRIGVVVANVALEGALRDRLQLQHNPKVRVHGIPFLTQVVGGTYQDIDVQASGLRDVHVPISDLGRWDFSTIPIDHVKAEVTVPYDSVVTAAGLGSATLTADGDQLDFSGPVTTPVGTLDVKAKLRPTISGEELHLDPVQASADGHALLPSVLAQLNYTVPLNDLPFGVKVNSVTVGKDGLTATATVDDVTIRDGELVHTG
jgi:hypothetical protein